MFSQVFSSWLQFQTYQIEWGSMALHRINWNLQWGIKWWGSKYRAFKYSGDLKSDHWKPGNIWNLDFLKVGYLNLQWENGGDPNTRHLNTIGIWNWDVFVQISNGFWQKGSQIWMDPIQNPDHLQPTFFQPFEIQNNPDFRSPLVLSCVVLGHI